MVRVRVRVNEGGANRHQRSRVIVIWVDYQ
jgi:hypothetical protein